MSFTDPIADMISRIRNAQMRALNTVSIPNSKFRARILDVLTFGLYFLMLPVLRLGECV